MVLFSVVVNKGPKTLSVCLKNYCIIFVGLLFFFFNPVSKLDSKNWKCRKYTSVNDNVWDLHENHRLCVCPFSFRGVTGGGQWTSVPVSGAQGPGIFPYTAARGASPSYWLPLKRNYRAALPWAAVVSLADIITPSYFRRLPPHYQFAALWKREQDRPCLLTLVSVA